MLINRAAGRLYYDLVGPENGSVVCFTHSLAADGGMWAEQLPPLLAAGYRVAAPGYAWSWRQRSGGRRLYNGESCR